MSDPARSQLRHTDAAETAPQSRLGETMIKGQPSSKTIADILGKLANDDDFRTKFAADPAGTLASFGVEVDPAKAPATVELPSKEALKTSLDSLQSKVESDAGLIFLLLK
jgi:putative modified peptide